MPTYFAQLENNIVIQVIVADQSFIDSLDGTWIETFIDNNKYYNYAGIGYGWDGIGFFPPQCHPEATLDSTTYQWACTNVAHTVLPE